MNLYGGVPQYISPLNKSSSINHTLNVYLFKKSINIIHQDNKSVLCMHQDQSVISCKYKFMNLFIHTRYYYFSNDKACKLLHAQIELYQEQGSGAEILFDALAPLLFNKLRLQLQLCSGNYTFQFEILFRNIYYKKER